MNIKTLIDKAAGVMLWILAVGTSLFMVLGALAIIASDLAFSANVLKDGYGWSWGILM